jgi:hypothetical protein
VFLVRLAGVRAALSVDGHADSLFATAWTGVSFLTNETPDCHIARDIPLLFSIFRVKSPT